ncbi:MAG: hypothetical protein ACYTFG_06310 [Planctomycetota bacterium]
MKKLEDAVDMKLIHFSKEKALRNDVNYYLRTWLHYFEFGHLAEDTLIGAGVLNHARSHRGKAKWFDPVTDKQLQSIEVLKDLLNSPNEVELDQDKDKTIQPWDLPKKDLEYRLTIRRACRALVKCGLCKFGLLEPMGDIIDIPIAGVIKRK